MCCDGTLPTVHVVSAKTYFSRLKDGQRDPERIKFEIYIEVMISEYNQMMETGSN